MRNATLALVLSACAALPAQFSCPANAQPPAVNLTCPCNMGAGGYGLGDLLYAGTGRIGTTSRFELRPTGLADYSALLVGIPSSAPLPIPPGIVACDNGAAVATLHLEPIGAYTSLGVSSLYYWIYVPAAPSLVGVTIALQGFSHQIGLGNAPFHPTMVVGLTLLP